MKGAALHSGNWGVALKALLHLLPLIEGQLPSEDGGAPHHCYPDPGSPSHFLQGCGSGTDFPPPTPLFPTPTPSCGEASAQSGLTPKHPWLELPKAIFFLFEKAHKTQGTERQNL